MQSLCVYSCFFPFLGLKNDEYASGKSKKSERRAIGRNDLIPGSVGEIDRR